MPFALRRLFATILSFCNPESARQLWGKFKEHMCEDYLHLNLTIHMAEKKALLHVNQMLRGNWKEFGDFNMQQNYLMLNRDVNYMQEINEELEIKASDDDVKIIRMLNERQKYAYDCIVNKVLNNEEGVFFIDGPGGTGKTFLYRALLATVRRKDYIALATASSGVAASILPGGRMHSLKIQTPY
ncbi:hypothetical protein Sjap_007369 [Stephania japonica]|uniref:ATP-dependent DNA helicase n=1 Tax=Stephania japonica TaxID=461633 RepID=A0AAP0JND2_9MAGN